MHCFDLALFISPFICAHGLNSIAPLAVLRRHDFPSYSELQAKGASHLDRTSTYRLSNGYEMPVIGFGVYRIPKGNDTYSSVMAAVNAGYRMIDTAEMYGNEESVGAAIRDSGIPRKEIFVTTKVVHSGHDAALEAGHKSNRKLGLGYIDLLLMHAPKAHLIDTYDALLELQRLNVTRSVGVSNFGVNHLQALKSYCRQAPVVNQLEMHPLIFEQRRGVVDYCRQNNIVMTAYGSVLNGQEELLSKANSIAEKIGKTNAQVMLRWALDEGFQVIPKSTHVARIVENMDIFDFTLTQQEISSLNTLKGHIDDYWKPVEDFPVQVSPLRQPPASC